MSSLLFFVFLGCEGNFNIIKSAFSRIYTKVYGTPAWLVTLLRFSNYFVSEIIRFDGNQVISMILASF